MPLFGRKKKVEVPPEEEFEEIGEREPPLREAEEFEEVSTFREAPFEFEEVPKEGVFEEVPSTEFVEVPPEPPIAPAAPPIAAPAAPPIAAPAAPPIAAPAAPPMAAPAAPPMAAPAAPPMAAPAAPPMPAYRMEPGMVEVSTQGQVERLDTVERVLEDAIRRIDTLDKLTETVKIDINQIKDTLNTVEANMRELTSLYDLISTQINPFIEAEAARAKASETIEMPKPEEGKLEALFEPTPELVAEREAVPVEGIEEKITPAPPILPEPTVPIEKPMIIPRLTTIGADSMCHIALLRWIEFMLSKVKREHITSLLLFYVKVGWISDGIRRYVIDIIRGIRPELMPEPSIAAAKEKEGDVLMAYDKEKMHEAKEAKKAFEEEWKLTPEDHLKTLIFIEKIRGTDIDKDKLEELERDVLRLKRGLEGFFGL
ncbi:MAG: FlaD/FlaE family flagellar protein [Candidatus Thermoplasmatota archaeon]